MNDSIQRIICMKHIDDINRSPAALDFGARV